MKKFLCFAFVLLLCISPLQSFAYAYQSEDIRLAIAMIEKAVQKADCYSYYCISADDAGFWLSVTQDGYAQEIANAKELGYNNIPELWEESRQSVIDVCDSFYTFIRDTMEIKNKIFSFFILDDTNRSNVLLVAISSTNGTSIIYEALNE